MAYRVVEGYVYPSNGATVRVLTVALIFLASVAGVYSIGVLTDVIQVLIAKY